MQLSDALFNNNLPGGAPPDAGFDLELSNPDNGADIFHRVRIQQTGACNGTATPSPSPTVTPSPTQAGSVTPTPTQAAIQTIILQPNSTYNGVADTYISSWNTEQNFGTRQEVAVRTRDEWVGLVRFNLQGSVPPNAIIQRAMLDLYVTSRSAGGVWSDVRAYQMLRPWTRIRQRGTGLAGASTWSVPGANGIGTDHTDLLLSQQRLDQVGVWVQFDITDAVVNWVSQPGSNQGITLRGSNNLEGSIAYNFASSTYPTANLRPRLTIRYSRQPQPLASRRDGCP